MVDVKSALISELRPLLGAHVERAFLWIWPCEEGPASTDTRLNLCLRLRDGATRSITFRTAPDEQTPLLEDEQVPSSQPFSALKDRSAAWTFGVVDEKGIYHREAFEITNAQDFGGLKDVFIEDIQLICFASSLAPAGLAIGFGSGRVLWSVSSGDGNRVFFQLPDPWFDEPMTLVSVAST